MPICPKCRRLCKTAQGLSGHMRFRHQMTVPKESLPLYAQERLEKAEAENARLREQVARAQRQRQDQETFYEKRMAEQKIELERAQERKLAVAQRACVLKQDEDQIRSERVRAQVEAIAPLLKQIQDLRKGIEQLRSQKRGPCELGKNPSEIGGQGTNTGKVGESISDLGKPGQDLRRERDRTSSSSLLPPLPPLFPPPLPPPPFLRDFENWLFGEDD